MQTVFEALLFAARLRLPENVTDSEKKARTMEVMEQLGLAPLANSRIGDRSRRGLSGGEMRRVSIGVELVGRPNILILDEPVSFLYMLIVALGLTRCVVQTSGRLVIRSPW